MAEEEVVENGVDAPEKPKERFATSFDVTKCLHHIEIPDLLHMCA